MLAGGGKGWRWPQSSGVSAGERREDKVDKGRKGEWVWWGPPDPPSAGGQGSLTPLALCLLWSCAQTGTCGVRAEAERVLLACCLKKESTPAPGLAAASSWAAMQDPALPHRPGGPLEPGELVCRAPRCRYSGQGRVGPVAHQPLLSPCGRRTRLPGPWHGRAPGPRWLTRALDAFGAGWPHCVLLARHGLWCCQLHRTLQHVVHLHDSWMPGTGASASLPALRLSAGLSLNPRCPIAWCGGATQVCVSGAPFRGPPACRSLWRCQPSMVPVLCHPWPTKPAEGSDSGQGLLLT